MTRKRTRNDEARRRGLRVGARVRHVLVPGLGTVRGWDEDGDPIVKWDDDPTEDASLAIEIVRADS